MWLRPDIMIGQDQWQGNQVKAQTFLYSDNIDTENIIVGSSLSYRLINDSLIGFTNLAFGGEAAYQGLELILIRGYFPKRIFIEINTLEKINESTFSDLLYNPVLQPARKYFPILRDGKQPLPLLENILESKVVNKVIPYKFSIFENRFSGKKEMHNKKISLVEQKQEMALDTNLILKRLKPYTDLLIKNNVEICFFEMPTNNFCNNPHLKTIKNMLIKNYPTPECIYIPNVGCHEYTTTDGLHLNPTEALKYTLYFKNQVDSLIIRDKL